jgi:hypothetical protein
LVFAEGILKTQKQREHRGYKHYHREVKKTVEGEGVAENLGVF